MPCSSDDGQDEYWNKEKYGFGLKTTDLLATLLCRACKRLEEGHDKLLPYAEDTVDTALIKWWEAHKIKDDL